MFFIIDGKVNQNHAENIIFASINQAAYLYAYDVYAWLVSE